MKKKIFLLAFCLVLAVAVFFRVYNLSSVPPSPSLDEVSIGYNAFSILHTSKDEYGNMLPLLLRAYDDWRPALYVYFVVPSVALFGLSPFAVRLPSVLMSLATILASYFIVIQLCKKHKQKELLGLITMFLLAISPWDVYISRLGHEVNLGLVVVVCAILTFLLSVSNKKNQWVLLISAALFSLSLLTYQSEKVFAPLILIVLVLWNWKQFIQMKKIIGISVLVGFIIAIPILHVSFSSEGLIRLQGTSALSNLNDVYLQNAQKLLVDKQHGNTIGAFFDNRRFIPIKIILGNYFSHINPYWLFSNSGKESFKAPNQGLLYLWELPLLLLGIFCFILKKDKVGYLLLLWIAVAFIAPAITTQAPHAMRAINVLPVPQLIEAYGLISTAYFLLGRSVSIKLVGLLISAGLIISIVIGCIQFYNNYFILFPKEESDSFQYALQQSLLYAQKHEGNYRYIVVSNTDALYQSYMFYLFINKSNPTAYLQNGGTKSGGFAQTHTIGKYQFHPIQWQQEKLNGLYIGNIKDFPQGQHTVSTFSNLDGVPAVEAVIK